MTLPESLPSGDNDREHRCRTQLETLARLLAHEVHDTNAALARLQDADDPASLTVHMQNLSTKLTTLLTYQERIHDVLSRNLSAMNQLVERLRDLIPELVTEKAEQVALLEATPDATPDVLNTARQQLRDVSLLSAAARAEVTFGRDLPAIHHKIDLIRFVDQTLIHRTLIDGYDSDRQRFSN